MSADKHSFPVAMDEAGRLFIKQRLCFDPTLDGIIPGEAEKVGCRWLHQDADGWFSIGAPAIIAAQGDSDALKLSGLRRVRIDCPSIDARAATEDAVDANHCEDWELNVGHLWAAQRYCGTIKGRSQRFRINVGCQHGHGKETDWDFGNFSDQGNGYTKAGTLCAVTEDKSAIAVRYLSAEPMQLEPSSQVFDVTTLNQGWFYPLFNFLKDALRLIGIKI